MLTRREFLKLCLSGAALSLSGVLLPKVAQALEEKGENATVIWLEMMTCTGDFLSFANTLRPDLNQLIKDTIRLEYENTLMAAEGDMALDYLFEVAQRKEGQFILIAEGTVPLRNEGIYGLIGHRHGKPVTDLEAIKFLGSRAKYVISAGGCAAFGGPYAASPNPSNSVPVYKVLQQTQVINVPGCPVHPDWLVGTLSHVLLYGMPELDSYGRPKMFFQYTIHDFCPRRQHFENGIFAKYPGDYGCMYEIGCKGPVTYSDCPTRKWNSAHLNWPIGANTPCIGCAAPEFPDGMSPFFAHLKDVDLPGINPNAALIGKAALGAAAAGISGHALTSLMKGRIKEHFSKGDITDDVDSRTKVAILEEQKKALERLETNKLRTIKQTLEKEKVLKRIMNTELSQELSPDTAQVLTPRKLRVKKLKVKPKKG